MSERREKIMKPFEAHKDMMEERIATGVELYRKGRAVIKVVDAAGKPVEGAKIELDQKSHDFKFGANCFMLDELETPEKNEAYKKAFADLFNMATLPFYWADLEPTEGELRFTKDSRKIYRRPTPDLCLEWCRENGIAPKLHCLNYDQWTPGWVPRDPASVKRLLDKRMREIGERYASEIQPIEVINETLLPEVTYDPFTSRHSTRFFHEPDLVSWSFEHARKYFPANELIMNEATERIWGDAFHYDRSNYYMQLERALEHDVSIDGIGMQFHMFFKREVEEEKTRLLYDPELIYCILDQYAYLRRPLSLTEVTVPAYSKDPEDEALQAEILTNLYRIWFSHPAMEHIIYWNVADGYAAFAPQGDMTWGENYYHGALLRFDMSKKPAYDALYHLIHEEWHTAVDAAADADGALKFKGFYGNYEVKVRVDGKEVTKTVHLEKGADNEFTVTI